MVVILIQSIFQVVLAWFPVEKNNDAPPITADFWQFFKDYYNDAIYTMPGVWIKLLGEK